MEISELSRDERFRLREELSASLIDEDAPIPEAHRKILNERIARIDRGESRSYTMEEIKSHIDQLRSARYVGS